MAYPRGVADSDGDLGPPGIMAMRVGYLRKA